ncbi:MAG: phospholipase A, partial [Myxococcota bacterium]
MLQASLFVVLCTIGVPENSGDVIIRPDKPNHFEAYRPNYFLFGDQEDQILFQFSFRYNLWPQEENRLGVFLAYTQRSWWDLYAFDDSSPFTENNYSPELVFRWRYRRFGVLGTGFDQVQFGFQHQSNGEDSVESRSWD